MFWPEQEVRLPWQVTCALTSVTQNMWKLPGDVWWLVTSWRCFLAEQQPELIPVNIKRKCCSEGSEGVLDLINMASPLRLRHRGGVGKSSSLAFTWGERAACSLLSLPQQWCQRVVAKSPLARHHRSSGNRRRSSGLGAAGEGCCQTASGPNPRWRPSRRKQEVWIPWADWGDRRRGGDFKARKKQIAPSGGLHLLLHSDFSTPHFQSK